MILFIEIACIVLALVVLAFPVTISFQHWRESLQDKASREGWEKGWRAGYQFAKGGGEW